MKPYKSLFKESSNIVRNENEAEQIVDISNLRWFPKHNVKEKTYTMAMKDIPRGYRLPTIQEMYTAYTQIENPLQNDDLFKWGFYWTSSKDLNGQPWLFDYPSCRIQPYEFTHLENWLFAMYVQEI